MDYYAKLTRLNLFGRLLLAFVLSACYLITVASDLTWANSGADGGDLISAAFTGGVAHPPGYPLYLLIARIFQMIPLGSLAFRTNLLSAVCTILAAVMLQAWLTRNLANRQYGNFCALMGGLSFGLAPLVWGQALITEVYGLNSLMIVLFLSGLDWEELPGGDWTRGLLLGLAASNHLASLILIPILALDMDGQSLFTSPSRLFKRLGGVAIGLTLYLILPLRALDQPPINWGNPITMPDFWWLVSARLYASYPLGASLADSALRLRAIPGLLVEQFTLPGVILGIYGLFSGIPRRILVISLWLFIGYSIFAIGYASYDSNVYLIPTYFAFSTWVASGLADLLYFVATRFSRLAPWIAALALLGLAGHIPVIYKQVDASQDTRALDFGARFVTQAPARALVISNGDEAVFALWYFQHALRLRPDTMIIAEELIQYDWYITILEQTYPALIIPSSHPITATNLMSTNPGRPGCFVVTSDVEFCRKFNPFPASTAAP